MVSYKNKKKKLNTKKTFLKKGTCSQAFFYILNREFGYPSNEHECATDWLAGGILQQGYQCGLLLGASMGVGAEAFRRNDNREKAIGVAIKSTQIIMESFVKIASSIECEDITSCDFKKKITLVKYFFTGKFLNCFNIAGLWAPDAIKSANEGLSKGYQDISEQTMSCASEIARKMGASDEEMVMVAGFAGGLGLSGNGCGALTTAIWMNSLNLNRAGNKKSSNHQESAEKILQAFYEFTNSEMECSKICRRKFKTIDEHTEYIKNGGCRKLFEILIDRKIIQ